MIINNKKSTPLHIKILIALFLGALFGFLMTYIDQGRTFISVWIYPLGQIFIKLLKLISIPLVMASLIKGITGLQDIRKLSNLGTKTLLIYISTTAVAILIGIFMVNLIKPGEGISKKTIERLVESNSSSEVVQKRISDGVQQSEKKGLDFLLEMIPDNVFSAVSDNMMMIQVIFFAFLFSVSMLLIPSEKTAPIRDFFSSLNDIVLKMVDLIILYAPTAVFALIANVVVSIDNPEIIWALAKYMFTVMLSLGLVVVFYMLLLFVFARINPFWFLKQIFPVQLLAFSTSSSSATLPVTMEKVQNDIGVDQEISSFVLPIGATLNMDGTSLYQAIATIFICEALQVDIGFQDQLTVILTALLASIGTPGVPGVGIVMLIVVLQSINFPPDKLPIGIALILSIDRILDMFRTAINVTGDATIATILAKNAGKLNIPKD